MTDQKIFCTDTGTTNILGLFDTTLAPELLYYSYIPIAILALLIGFIVLQEKKNFKLENGTFFFITIVFTLYIVNEILQWITVPADIVYFEWQLITLFFSFFAFSMLYFTYTFLYKRDLDFKYNLILFFLWLPIPLLLPTKYNMQNFDLFTCEASIGPLFVAYSYVSSIFTAVIITLFCLNYYVILFFIFCYYFSI